MSAESQLWDELDRRLLEGFADWAVERSGAPACGVSERKMAVNRYLDEEISLGKLTEFLGISRFEFQQRLHRLGMPLHLGPATLAEARTEVEIARR